MFNEQLSEQEYKKRKAEMPFWDSSVRDVITKRLQELKKNTPHRYMRSGKVDMVTGDYMYKSKNTFESFFCEKCEDSAYLGQTIDMKDCYDANFTENDELLYNYLGSWKVQRALCSFTCYNGHDHKGRCAIQFQTSYASDRPEIVYCELCYQKEII